MKRQPNQTNTAWGDEQWRGKVKLTWQLKRLQAQSMYSAGKREYPHCHRHYGNVPNHIDMDHLVEVTAI